MKTTIFLLLLVVGMLFISACGKTEVVDDTTTEESAETEEMEEIPNIEEIDDTQYNYDDVDVDLGDVV